MKNLNSHSNLSHGERINLLRVCAGRLQADRDAAARWLGRSLIVALEQGLSIDVAVGYRPGQGSRRTAQAIIKREAADNKISDLVRQVGVARASEMLLGTKGVPANYMALVADIRQLNVGLSRASISRAVKRSRHKA